MIIDAMNEIDSGATSIARTLPLLNRWNWDIML